MGIQSRNKVSMSFSMSSMTDIVFLLLIFFIVISTLISPYGLNVLLPESSQRNTTPKNVTITITPDKQFYLNGEEVPIDAMESQLRKKLSDIENPGIILKADVMVPHGIVVKIMDIANRNNYKLVIATSPG